MEELQPELGYRTLCGACAPVPFERLFAVVISARCAGCGVQGKSPELYCYPLESAPDRPAQAVSSAPFVALLRILERTWKERATLSADLVERLREQLEGPLGLKAKADERVLELMESLSPDELVGLASCGLTPRQREVLRRLVGAENERRRIRP